MRNLLIATAFWLGVGSAAHAAEPCTLDGQRLAADFTPEIALPALDAAIACVETRSASFAAAFQGDGLAATLRAARETYGLPADTTADISELARVAAQVQSGFYGAAAVLRDARARIAAGEDMAALAEYTLYVAVALRRWSATDAWLNEEAWPDLAALHARRAWHAARHTLFTEDIARIEGVWAKLNADIDARRASDPAHAGLMARQTGEAVCSEGLNLAIASLTWRIETLSLIPHLETFVAPEAAPTLPPRPPEPPEAPTACAISADPGTARMMWMPADAQLTDGE